MSPNHKDIIWQLQFGDRHYRCRQIRGGYLLEKRNHRREWKPTLVQVEQTPEQMLRTLIPA